MQRKKVAEIFTQRFNLLFPESVDKIEMTNVSTPLTVTRYIGSMGGSLLGWIPFSDAVEPLEAEVKKSGPVLPGLKNFYMAGQWIHGGGGLITTASSGRCAAQYICYDDDKKFTATEP
ncbi:MAG: hypothetical protein Q9M50_13140 [Methylococcales bacterium]|nr:hypothetical protein [Methylococcales bacterium]